MNTTILDKFTKTYEGQYKYPTTVRHKGTVIAFAMNEQREIVYTVLALNQTRSEDATGTNDTDSLDVNYWQETPSRLIFPTELAKIGYGIADQFLLPVFSIGRRAQERFGTILADLGPSLRDYFHSTTARFSADAPFQVLSDGRYVYVFRQAIADPVHFTGQEKSDAQKPMVFVDAAGHMVTSWESGDLGYRKKDGVFQPSTENEISALVDSTLLVDRFILSGTTLQTKREVRFQRSRSKTRPQSRKDGLGANDLDGNPFLEPTQELKFIGNLHNGRFTVLLLPTVIQEIQRWQFFTHNSHTGLIDSFDVERSPDGLFNTRGSQVYTCIDHPDVFADKAGSCTEPGLGNPSQLCNKERIPRLRTRGHAESALTLAAKTSAELRTEFQAALKGQGHSDLFDSGTIDPTVEPHMSLGIGITLGQKFTQEAWILPHASSTQSQALLNSTGGDSRSNSLQSSRATAVAGPSVWVEAGSRVRVGFGDGRQWNECATNSLLTPDQWNHLAITFDGNAYRFYVDGRLRQKIELVSIYVEGVLQMNGDNEKQEHIAGKQLPDDSPIKFIGAAVQTFGGTIDEIRLWNRVRSQKELQASLHQRLTGLETGLAGYWRFDEAGGNTVYDQTINSVNGQLNGSPVWQPPSSAADTVKPVSVEGWQWVTSDAPLGENLGISRSSFRLTSQDMSTDDPTNRNVASGLTALLYYQQENVTSGYAAEEKPLKRNARVMLAVATSAQAESSENNSNDSALNIDRNNIATLDFAVSSSGKLAQIPDIVPLRIINAPEAQGQSINQQLNEASRLNEQRRGLQQDIDRLQPQIDYLEPVLNILSDASQQSPQTINIDDISGISNREFLRLIEPLNESIRAIQGVNEEVQVLEDAVRSAVVTISFEFELGISELLLKVGTLSGQQLVQKASVLRNTTRVYIRAIARELQVTASVSDESNTYDGAAEANTTFRDVQLNWQDESFRLEIAESAEYARATRTAQTSAQNDFDRQRQRLRDLNNIASSERDAKSAQLDELTTELNALQATLKSGVAVPMSLVYTDPFGLTISGGLLDFAWTNETPQLFDSATGNLALYFRGTDNQFFVTYYSTYTERSKTILLDEDARAIVTCIARSTEREMDDLTTKISGASRGDTCTLTISGAGIEETWHHLPRAPQAFANIVNGLADGREYIGTGKIVVQQGMSNRLNMPGGVKQSLSAGDTLFIGKAKLTVQLNAAVGVKNIAIIPASTPLPSGTLPVFFVEYDYAANAQTTKLPNDLYNGSLLIRAQIGQPGEALSVQTGRVQTEQSATSTSTLSSKWTAAAPGSALSFNGSGDYAGLTPTSDVTKFSASGDLTLETWARPHRIQESHAQIIQHYESSSSNYALGIRRKELLSAMEFDGENSIDLGTAITLPRHFTQEAWIYPDIADEAEYLGILGSAEVDRVQQPPSLFVDGKGSIRAGFGNGQAWYGIDSEAPVLSDGIWNHVAVTYDGNSYKLYVNGVLKEIPNVSGDIIGKVPVNRPLEFIGRAEKFFRGRIDDVRIWKRARTQADIQIDMDRRLGGNETDLIGYWHFEHGRANDYSRNANNGRPSQDIVPVASPLPAYSFFAGVNNLHVSSQDVFAGGNWTHLAAVFHQAYGLKFSGRGYLDCGNDVTLDISGDLTIEVYLQVESFGCGILSRGSFNDETSEQNVPYALFLNTNGTIGFAFQDVEHRPPHQFKSNINIPVVRREFTKIAVTRKRITQQREKRDADGNPIGVKITSFDRVTFYVNGEPAGSAKYESDQDTEDDVRQPVNIGNSNQALQVGQSFQLQVDTGHLYSVSSFKGIISELRIWNKSLEPNEVAQKLKGKEQGLIAWWMLQENEGNTAFDAKGNNHATIKGDISWVKDPDPQGSELSLYCNGRRIGPSPIPDDQRIDTDTVQFTLAAQSQGDDIRQYLQGELEELRIWKTTRTHEQIQDNMFRRLLGEQTDLIAYYTFDLDSERTNANLTTLYDRSSHGNDLSVSGATYVLSTAPISNDSPNIRSALAGVKTTFHDLIESQPGVEEYGDVQYDAAGNMIGVYKRCYSFIRKNLWQIVTSFKVGDLVTEWISQIQTAPQLIGYIEGAPPVPSENLTATGYVLGEFSDYTGASSIELSQAQSTNYTYAASRETGVDFTLDAKFGLAAGTEVNLGLFVITEAIDVDNFFGVHDTIDTSFGWLEDARTSVGRTTTGTTKMALRGYVENKDAIAYPNMGRRFVPENTGMAFVKSETADVFALRLKHNQALVSFQMRPNPDIPPDRNIITFPLNSSYTKQGTLDGKIGVLDTDPDYPNAHTYSPDISYFKPIEAYSIKERINRQEVELQTYYQQYDASNRGRRSAGVYGGEKDLASGNMLEKLPHLHKRNLVNSYVWTAGGGLFAETQESMDMYQEQSGGSYAFQGMHGLSTTLGFEISGVGLRMELDALIGGHVNLTVTKDKESQTSFGLNVEIDSVESDLYLRDEQGKIVMDDSTIVDPDSAHAVRKLKPKLMPGRVDAYRFMSFYLEPESDHFDTFFNRVVDPIWLAQSDDPNAVALREAQQRENNCWRIMHRVTYVSRVLPPLSDPAPSSLDKALQTLDINSNYELIKQLEPFVSISLGSYPEFTKAVRDTIKLYLPELQQHEQEIIQYMSLYFGIVENQDTPGQGAGEEIESSRVLNRAPVVNAGVDETIGLDGPNVTTTLEGNAIDDRIDKSEALFATWKKTVGDGDVIFSNPHSLKTEATFTTRGRYVLQLTVHDGTLSSTDDVTIIVNQRPVISAGDELKISPFGEDGQSVTDAMLVGRIIDSGLGDPRSGRMSLRWTLQSTRGKVTFSDDTALETKANFSQSNDQTAGSYLLRLAADNGSFKTSSEVQVTIAARVTDQLLALYTFEDEDDGVVSEVSGAHKVPLNLSIAGEGVRWGEGVLIVQKPTVLSTDRSVPQLVEAMQSNNEATIEAWITPAVDHHDGLARIVTLSGGPSERNVILGQSDNHYYFAIRTTTTTDNASDQALEAKSPVKTNLTHVVCTRTSAGESRIYIDGRRAGIRDVGGDLSGWNNTFKLTLGNESEEGASPARAWLGKFHLVALYSRALSPQDIQQNYHYGADTNLPPIVSAGEDKIIDESTIQPVEVQLVGRATHDRSSRSITSTWSQVSGPRTPVGVTLVDKHALITKATFADNGRYVMRLTVDDGELMTSDELSILINKPPVVTIQSAPSIALTEDTVTSTLKGIVTNLGLGEPGDMTYQWKRRSGPQIAFTSTDQLETSVSFSNRGIHEIELTVNNGKFSATSVASIAVDSVPSIRAGEAQIVTLPTRGEVVEDEAPQAEVTLEGVIVDSGLSTPLESSELLFEWQKVDGPGEIKFADAGSRVTTATFITGGAYKLRLTATNNTLAQLTHNHEVSIEVNQPPVVNVGARLSVQLSNKVELEGTVSDDGLPTRPGTVTTKWEKVSGPGTVTFDDETANYTNAQFSQAGNYVLRLTADDTDSKGSDEITVEVISPPRISDNLLILYTFSDAGEVIQDKSEREPLTNLTISGDAEVAEIHDATLKIYQPTIVASGAVTELINIFKGEAVESHGITIEAWIKPNSAEGFEGQQSPARIVTLSENPNSRCFTLGQIKKRYVIRLRTNAEDPNGTNKQLMGGSVVTDRLTHLVYTWSAESQIARLYQDGKQVAEKNDVSVDFSSWSTDCKLALGNEFEGGERAWLGDIQLVAIYNSALTRQEIEQNMSAHSLA